MVDGTVALAQLVYRSQSVRKGKRCESKQKDRGLSRSMDPGAHAGVDFKKFGLQPRLGT